MNRNINELFQFVRQPEVNMDVWQMLDRVSQMFDKRVGLTELLYGMTATQSRTAADIKVKHEQLSIRPEYMAGRVEAWQSEAANIEKFAATWNVQGRDIQPLVGNVGSMMWDQLISNVDPELVVREMKATVEAGSAKKPNKAKDIGNLTQLSGFMLPELSKHADATGDTKPINAYFRSLGDALDQDVSEWQMGSRRPEPSPEQQQMAQQQAQLQAASMQADIEQKQVDSQVKRGQLDIKAMEAQLKATEDQIAQQEQLLELQQKQLEHEQGMVHAEETHQQKIAQAQEKGLLDLELKQADHAMRQEMLRENPI